LTNPAGADSPKQNVSTTWQSGNVDLRDALAVWRRNVIVHLRVWKMNLVAPIIEPVLILDWLGDRRPGAGQVSGISYLSFAGAGLRHHCADARDVRNDIRRIFPDGLSINYDAIPPRRLMHLCAR
jgi:hypothetical protein